MVCSLQNDGAEFCFFLALLNISVKDSSCLLSSRATVNLTLDRVSGVMIAWLMPYVQTLPPDLKSDMLLPTQCVLSALSVFSFPRTQCRTRKWTPESAFFRHLWVTCSLSPFLPFHSLRGDQTLCVCWPYWVIMTVALLSYVSCSPQLCDN